MKLSVKVLSGLLGAAALVSCLAVGAMALEPEGSPAQPAPSTAPPTQDEAPQELSGGETPGPQEEGTPFRFENLYSGTGAMFFDNSRYPVYSGLLVFNRDSIKGKTHTASYNERTKTWMVDVCFSQDYTGAYGVDMDLVFRSELYPEDAPSLKTLASYNLNVTAPYNSYYSSPVDKSEIDSWYWFFGMGTKNTFASGYFSITDESGETRYLLLNLYKEGSPALADLSLGLSAENQLRVDDRYFNVYYGTAWEPLLDEEFSVASMRYGASGVRYFVLNSPGFDKENPSESFRMMFCFNKSQLGNYFITRLLDKDGNQISCSYQFIEDKIPISKVSEQGTTSCYGTLIPAVAWREDEPMLLEVIGQDGFQQYLVLHINGAKGSATWQDAWTKLLQFSPASAGDFSDDILKDAQLSVGSSKENEAWLGLRERLLRAKDGDEVFFDATDYPRIPYYIVDTLAGRNVILRFKTSYGEVPINGTVVKKSGQDRIFYNTDEFLADHRVTVTLDGESDSKENELKNSSVNP